MIGKRVEWHVRGTRPLTPEERELLLLRWVLPGEVASRTTQAFSHPSDLLGGAHAPCERYALAAHWHATDEVRRGKVMGWNVNECVLLVERDDGAWEEVLVVCVRSAEAA